MKGQIYQAFVEAGFGREASLLSTTIDGKVVPALGHAIAVLDNLDYCGEANLTKLRFKHEGNNYKSLISKARTCISSFIDKQREKINLKAGYELISPMGILETDTVAYNKLNKFTNSFNKIGE